MLMCERTWVPLLLSSSQNLSRLQLALCRRESTLMPLGRRDALGVLWHLLLTSFDYSPNRHWLILPTGWCCRPHSYDGVSSILGFSVRSLLHCEGVVV